MIGISVFQIRSKTMMELIFNPGDEFLCEVRRALLAKSTPLPSMWCPSDLFRSFKVSSNAKERVGCGKQLEATASIKSLVKLQPWFLSLRWKTCLRQNCSPGFSACSEGPAFGQNTHDDDDDGDVLQVRSETIAVHRRTNMV